MSGYDLKQEVTDKYSLRGRVFSKIREDILSGKYKDHEELKEVAIGEELGVSRTPVREAFRQLELEGLIQIVPNKGAYVTNYGKGCGGYLHDTFFAGRIVRQMGHGVYYRRATGRVGGKRVSGGFPCRQRASGPDGGAGQPFPSYFV